jgi:hypothetical protein
MSALPQGHNAEGDCGNMTRFYRGLCFLMNASSRTPGQIPPPRGGQLRENGRGTLTNGNVEIFERGTVHLKSCHAD